MNRLVEVVVISNNTIVREGLRRIVEEKDFTIRQSVDSISKVRGESIQGEEPFILLADADDPHFQLEHVPAVQRRFPQARVVLLSDSFEFDTMAKAFRLGVYGYMVKELACEPLIGSLQLIAMGEKVMPSQLAEELPKHASDFYPANSNKTLESADLTDREAEILQCLIMGCPNKVISRHLEISEATVKVHVKAILRKLRVQNRTQAAIWAVNHGVEGFGAAECDNSVPEQAPSVMAETETAEMAAA
jgi:two-component system nitrate/nitrite response regulator NarL